MVKVLKDHSLTIALAVLWLGPLTLAGAIATDHEKWLQDVATGHADAAYGALILLFFGRILWLHERGREDKRKTEEPDV